MLFLALIPVRHYENGSGSSAIPRLNTSSVTVIVRPNSSHMSAMSAPRLFHQRLIVCELQPSAPGRVSCGPPQIGRFEPTDSRAAAAAAEAGRGRGQGVKCRPARLSRHVPAWPTARRRRFGAAANALNDWNADPAACQHVGIPADVCVCSSNEQQHRTLPKI